MLEAKMLHPAFIAKLIRGGTHVDELAFAFARGDPRRQLIELAIHRRLLGGDPLVADAYELLRSLVPDTFPQLDGGLDAAS